MCSSGSISHFAAKREREQLRAHRFAELRLGQQQEVLRPRRHTRSGAISRLFGVSSSASTTSPAVTSFESIRWR